MPNLKKIESSLAPKALGPYSQAIFATPFIFVSGQLAIDPSTGKMIDPDIRNQINRVWENIEEILKASNCTLQNIVRYEIFMIDLKDFPVVNEECAKRLTHSILPARQTIQVARLPLDALVEISCIAIQS